MQPAKRRDYGIELLRIISMCMIIMLHTLKRSGLLYIDCSFRYGFVWFVEICCYCAVNCFVLISGYVSVHSDFRISRIIILWIQVAFYNVGFEIIHQLHTSAFELEKIVISFFPVITKSHWFFTCFFYLSFFMPFINKMVKGLNYCQRWFLAGILFLCYSVLPMLLGSPLPFIGNRIAAYVATENGYSVTWFCIMYAFGAVIRCNNDDKPADHSKVIGAVGYCICVLFTWALWAIHVWLGILPGKAAYVVNYTAPGMVLAAVSLFHVFRGLHLPKCALPIVDFFSASAFSVYLIHSQERVYGHHVEIVAPLVFLGGRKLLVYLPLAVVLLYLVCTLIDRVRVAIFRKIGVDKTIKKIDIFAQNKLNGLL